ncbi:MAG: MarR family transcriptional regulator [Halanaerobiales bacterium]
MDTSPIGKYLSITHRAHTSLVDKNFKEKFNISHGQVFILIKIFKNEGINQHKLCKEYNLNKAGVGRIIKKLEAKNLVKRKPDPKDKRKKMIFLTEKAKSLKPEFIELLETVEAKIKNNLTEEEIEMFLKILKKIYNNLSDNKFD